MGGQNPVDGGSRVIAISIALFMMIVMSTYTAMLTAITVTYHEKVPITGFKDEKVKSFLWFCSFFP